MNLNGNPFRTLSSRAQYGDSAAAAELDQRLPTAMVYMVRRELRVRTGATPQARRILEVARALDPDNDCQEYEDHERLVEQVTRQVCKEVVHEQTGLGSPWRVASDTVVDLPRLAKASNELS